MRTEYGCYSLASSSLLHDHPDPSTMSSGVQLFPCGVDDWSENLPPVSFVLVLRVGWVTCAVAALTQ